MENYNYLKKLPEPTILKINGISIQLYVVEDDTWLFDNRQVAQNYGISENTVRAHLRRNKNVLIEGKHWFKKRGRKPPRYPEFNLWTKEGFVTIGNFIKTTKANNLLVALGITSKQITKIESQIIEIIRDAFEGNTKVESHYSVQGYTVDIYFPQLNIIVEIDEMNHESYDSGDEYLREILIQNSLNCEIIHYNPHDINDSIGKVINKILKRLMLT